jgi:folylpolyglutamate synthase/dihydropteroate synthase
MKMCQDSYRIEQLQNLNNEQVVRLGKNGEQIVSQKQNILTLKDALALEKIEKEKYMKSVQAQAKLGIKNTFSGKTVIYHDTVERLVYVDTSYGELVDDTTVYIKVPLKIEYRDSWNLFQGTLGEEVFFIDSITVKNELRLTIGYEKQGLFKEPKPIVEVKSSNPEAQVTIIDNVIIDKPEPFYKKAWFGIIVGVGATLLLL